MPTMTIVWQEVFTLHRGWNLTHNILGKIRHAQKLAVTHSSVSVMILTTVRTPVM